MGEPLGPSSDELEPVQSVSREVLLTEEPLDTELPPEGVALRPPVGREWMLCWGSLQGPYPSEPRASVPGSGPSSSARPSPLSPRPLIAAI